MTGVRPSTAEPSDAVCVRFVRLPHAADLVLPERSTAGSAGLDLRAATGDEVVLEVGARALIPTGLQFAIPEGYEAQIRPRSGLALKYGVTVLNTPGTIDSDYRGEVGVVLINLGESRFRIAHGDRIAQVVVAPVVPVVLKESESLSETARGEGGFGSTGRD